MAEAEESVARMLRVLDLRDPLARTAEDIFTAESHPMPSGRIFGGQVLAQAVLAAERTVEPGRIPHSMHGYFLRPGDANEPVTIGVDRIHDGRSFARRRTQVYQRGIPIFSMIASFEHESEGLEHSATPPHGIPDPDELTPSHLRVGGAYPEWIRTAADTPIEVRHVSSPIYAAVDSAEPHQAVWMRTRAALPDDPRLQRALLAYLSDLSIQESVLRAHGIAWSHPGLNVASLDHAMWWHAPARVDEWLLYVQESPNARGGRGLATGRIFRRDGELAASVAQEIMVRIPEHR